MKNSHTYEATAHWRGSTGVGYEAYDRAHTLTTGQHDLDLSSDPAFLGDPRRLNPEQLLLAAAVSCQLLSFLAVAARARIDVLGYEDDATAVMPEDDPPTRITRITLRPSIVLRTGPSESKVRHLVEVAHRECYIANSVKTEIEIVPVLRFVELGIEATGLE
jgi:organic hydroperoxide reductase OsmC/OhrA